MNTEIEIIAFIINTKFVEFDSDDRESLLLALIREGIKREKSVLFILQVINVAFACPFLDEAIAEYRKDASVQHMAKSTYDNYYSV